MEQGASPGAPLNTPTGQPTNIKAIPTRYKGYHFRSRLEARWAVFFDALGYAWEYEPEGYDLGAHGRYLPDFRVWYRGTLGVGIPHWIEVKGVPPNAREKTLAEELFWATRIPVAIVHGEIRSDYLLGAEKRTVGVPAHVPLQGVMFGCWGYAWAHEMDIENLDGPSRLLLPTGPDKVAAAVRAARSARFEHGESGAPRSRSIGGEGIRPLAPLIADTPINCTWPQGTLHASHGTIGGGTCPGRRR